MYHIDGLFDFSVHPFPKVDTCLLPWYNTPLVPFFYIFQTSVSTSSGSHFGRKKQDQSSVWFTFLSAVAMRDIRTVDVHQQTRTSHVAILPFFSVFATSHSSRWSVRDAGLWLALPARRTLVYARCLIIKGVSYQHVNRVAQHRPQYPSPAIDLHVLTLQRITPQLTILPLALRVTCPSVNLKQCPADFAAKRSTSPVASIRNRKKNGLG